MVSVPAFRVCRLSAVQSALLAGAGLALLVVVSASLAHPARARAATAGRAADINRERRITILKKLAVVLSCRTRPDGQERAPVYSVTVTV